MRKNLLISLLLCILAMGAQAQLKPRVVILTDIGQPDLEPAFERAQRPRDVPVVTY